MFRYPTKQAACQAALDAAQHGAPLRGDYAAFDGDYTDTQRRAVVCSCYSPTLDGWAAIVDGPFHSIYAGREILAVFVGGEPSARRVTRTFENWKYSFWFAGFDDPAMPLVVEVSYATLLPLSVEGGTLSGSALADLVNKANADPTLLDEGSIGHGGASLWGVAHAQIA